MRQIEIANPDTLYGVLSMFFAQKWTNKAIFNDSKNRDLIEHLGYICDISLVTSLVNSLVTSLVTNLVTP